MSDLKVHIVTECIRIFTEVLNVFPHLDIKTLNTQIMRFSPLRIQFSVGTLAYGNPKRYTWGFAVEDEEITTIQLKEMVKQLIQVYLITATEEDELSYCRLDIEEEPPLKLLRFGVMFLCKKKST